jgi:tetratricopeptide (TPR) repeat protein
MAMPVTVDLRGPEERLRRQFKEGLHDEDFFQQAELLLGSTLQASDGDPLRASLDVLKARNICAEVFDLKGDTTSRRRAVEGGETIFNTLPANLRAVSTECAREQLRFCGNWIRIHHYREFDYERAVKHLFTALECLKSISTDDFPCHGTRGMLSYYLGCALRQAGRLNEGEGLYGQAIDAFRLRAAWAVRHIQAANLRLEMKHIRHNIAIILGLGLGWVYSQRGNLRQALDSAISPAQALLTDSPDVLHAKYLDLLRCSNERARAGRQDSAQLRRCVSVAENAFSTFSAAPYFHRTYSARAAFELALCHLALESTRDAEQWIQRFEEYAPPRWQASVLLLQSRHQRLQGAADEALRSADEAVSTADNQQEQLLRLDALIERAQCKIAHQQYGGARDDLTDVLRSLERPEFGNRKIEAVAHVHMASAYCKEGLTFKAQEHLARWRQLSPFVEHKVIGEMADVVDQDVQTFAEDLTFRWSSGPLSHTDADAMLHLWLLRRAKARGFKNQRQIRDHLGISQPAFRDWLAAEPEWQRIRDALKSKPENQ